MTLPMTLPARAIKGPVGTTLFALATALVMGLCAAGRTAAQSCGFCDALQTAYGNAALQGDGGVENSAFGTNALDGKQR
jgi:hypothetical protein